MIPHQIELTSAANPEIKTLRTLNTKKGRAEQGTFLSEGLRHVVEAARAGWTIRRLVLSRDARPGALLDEACDACAQSGGRILRVPPQLMERIAKRDNAQSVLAEIEQRRVPLSGLSLTGSRVLLALEEVRDPGNLGSILRTADAFGVEGLILVGQCCDPFSVEAVRASMGSLVNVPVTECDREAFLEWHRDWHRNWNGETVGTHLRGDAPPSLRNVDGNLLILMGNEQAGLSDALAGICGRLVRIPMRQGADSLNLAAATAIILHEAAGTRLPD
jgi:TrmH family RNA methyltransferase